MESFIKLLSFVWSVVSFVLSILLFRVFITGEAFWDSMRITAWISAAQLLLCVVNIVFCAEDYDLAFYRALAIITGVLAVITFFPLTRYLFG